MNKPIALEAVNDRGFTVRVISTYFLFDVRPSNLEKSRFVCLRYSGMPSYCLPGVRLHLRGHLSRPLSGPQPRLQAALVVEQLKWVITGTFAAIDKNHRK